MKISTRTEYGIRVLVTLARATDADACLSLTEIARREKLPHAYLEQLVRDLRTAGLVTATRGQAGGYRLARPAAEIAMTEAVRALEGPILEMPCAGAEDLEHCDRPAAVQRPRGLPARVRVAQRVARRNEPRADRGQRRRPTVSDRGPSPPNRRPPGRDTIQTQQQARNA